MQTLEGLERALAILVEMRDALDLSSSSKRLARILRPPPTTASTLDAFQNNSLFDWDKATAPSPELIPQAGADPELDHASEQVAHIEQELEDILNTLKAQWNEPGLKWYHRGKEPYQVDIPARWLARHQHSGKLDGFQLMSQGGKRAENARYWNAKIRALVQAGTRLPALAPAAFDAHSKASQLHARFSLLIRRATNTHPKARPSMPEAEEMMCAAFDDSWTSTSWELGRADLQSRLVALYTYALSVSLLPAQTHVQNGLPSPSGVCSV